MPYFDDLDSENDAYCCAGPCGCPGARRWSGWRESTGTVEGRARMSGSHSHRQSWSYDDDEYGSVLVSEASGNRPRNPMGAGGEEAQRGSLEPMNYWARLRDALRVKP